MQKKIYILENLDCANCAAKIEAKINAHPSVQEAVITFSTRQLRLAAENPDSLIDELQAIARTVESEVSIRSEAHIHNCHHEEECCGHAHHECHCGHEHPHDHTHIGDQSAKPLLIGGGLFAAGLFLEHFGLKWAAMAVCAVAYVLLGRDVVKKAVHSRGRWRAPAPEHGL